MTLDYFLAAVWGLILLVAFVGHGKLLRRLLFPGRTCGWASEAAWGMALVVALGGCLNLFFLVSPPLVVAHVVIGVASSVLSLIARRKTWKETFFARLADVKERPWRSLCKVLGYGSIITLVGLQYLGAVTTEVHHWNYVVMDDLRGYYLFPKQMLETGGITADPFNFMRLGNGLGGQAILHALMLVFFDFYNILLLEAGVALIIAVGLVWRIATNRGLGFPWKWALAVVFLCLPYYPSLIINTSSFITGMLMLLALFAFLDDEHVSTATPVRNAFIVSLLAACACALKTTFLPPVVVILGLSYLWFLLSGRGGRTTLLETALVPLFVLCLLLPWMLSLLNSSGTMLYPLLGTGFDEYNYGNYIGDTQIGGFSLSQKLNFIFLTFFSRDIYLLLMVAGLAVPLLAKFRQRAATQAVVIGTLISSVAILLNVDVTKTTSLNRYLYCVVYVAVIVATMELMAAAVRRKRTRLPEQSALPSGTRFAAARKILASATLIILASLFFWQAGYAGKTWDYYQFFLHILPEKMASQGTFFPEDWLRRYRQAQESVPAGEAILSFDTATAAYDFSRNPIDYLSLPGAGSPSPGMPYFSGPETIAGYLQTQGIRYLAFNYGSDGGLPIMENMFRIRPDADYTKRIFQRAAVALNLALKELGATRRRLYDDGSLFVLDLQQPAPVPRAYRPPNYFQKAKILSPGWAETSGFGRNKIWTDGHGVISGIHYQLDPQDRILALNTFGYHPWMGNVGKLQMRLSVNDIPLPLMGFRDRSYYFSLAPVRAPITRISIDSITFVPREEQIRFGKDDDSRVLGVDVDTIEIKSAP